MNIDIKNLIQIHKQILIYGSIYNGKYTYVKEELKKDYHIFLINYLLFLNLLFLFLLLK